MSSANLQYLDDVEKLQKAGLPLPHELEKVEQGRSEATQILQQGQDAAGQLLAQGTGEAQALAGVLQKGAGNDAVAGLVKQAAKAQQKKAAAKNKAPAKKEAAPKQSKDSAKGAAKGAAVIQLPKNANTAFQQVAQKVDSALAAAPPMQAAPLMGPAGANASPMGSKVDAALAQNAPKKPERSEEQVAQRRQLSADLLKKHEGEQDFTISWAESQAMEKAKNLQREFLRKQGQLEQVDLSPVSQGKSPQRNPHVDQQMGQSSELATDTQSAEEIAEKKKLSSDLLSGQAYGEEKQTESLSDTRSVEEIAEKKTLSSELLSGQAYGEEKQTEAPADTRSVEEISEKKKLSSDLLSGKAYGEEKPAETAKDTRSEEEIAEKKKLSADLLAGKAYGDAAPMEQVKDSRSEEQIDERRQLSADLLKKQEEEQAFTMSWSESKALDKETERELGANNAELQLPHSNTAQAPVEAPTQEVDAPEVQAQDRPEYATPPQELLMAAAMPAIKNPVAMPPEQPVVRTDESASKAPAAKLSSDKVEADKAPAMLQPGMPKVAQTPGAKLPTAQEMSVRQGQEAKSETPAASAPVQQPEAVASQPIAGVHIELPQAESLPSRQSVQGESQAGMQTPAVPVQLPYDEAEIGQEETEAEGQVSGGQPKKNQAQIQSEAQMVGEEGKRKAAIEEGKLQQQSETEAESKKATATQERDQKEGQARQEGDQRIAAEEAKGEQQRRQADAEGEAQKAQARAEGQSKEQLAQVEGAGMKAAAEQARASEVAAEQQRERAEVATEEARGKQEQAQIQRDGDAEEQRIRAAGDLEVQQIKSQATSDASAEKQRGDTQAMAEEQAGRRKAQAREQAGRAEQRRKEAQARREKADAPWYKRAASWFMSKIDGLFSAAKRAWNTAKSAARGLVNRAMAAGRAIRDSAARAARGIYQVADRATGGALTRVATAVKNTARAVRDKVSNAIQVVASTINRIKESVKNSINSAIARCKAGILAAASWVREKVNAARAWLSEKVNAAVTWVKNKYNQIKDAVVAAVKTAVKWVADAVKAYYVFWRDALKAIGSWLSEQWTKFKEWAQEAFVKFWAGPWRDILIGVAVALIIGAVVVATGGAGIVLIAAVSGAATGALRMGGEIAARRAAVAIKNDPERAERFQAEIDQMEDHEASKWYGEVDKDEAWMDTLQRGGIEGAKGFAEGAITGLMGGAAGAVGTNLAGRAGMIATKEVAKQGAKQVAKVGGRRALAKAGEWGIRGGADMVTSLAGDVASAKVLMEIDVAAGIRTEQEAYDFHMARYSSPGAIMAQAGGSMLTGGLQMGAGGRRGAFQDRALESVFGGPGSRSLTRQVAHEASDMTVGGMEGGMTAGLQSMANGGSFQDGFGMGFVGGVSAGAGRKAGSSAAGKRLAAANATRVRTDVDDGGGSTTRVDSDVNDVGISPQRSSTDSDGPKRVSTPADIELKQAERLNRLLPGNVEGMPANTRIVPDGTSPLPAGAMRVTEARRYIRTVAAMRKTPDGRAILKRIADGEVHVTMEGGVGSFFDGNKRINVDPEIRGRHNRAGILSHEEHHARSRSELPDPHASSRQEFVSGMMRNEAEAQARLFEYHKQSGTDANAEFGYKSYTEAYDNAANAFRRSNPDATDAEVRTHAMEAGTKVLETEFGDATPSTSYTVDPTTGEPVFKSGAPANYNELYGNWHDDHSAVGANATNRRTTDVDSESRTRVDSELEAAPTRRRRVIVDSASEKPLRATLDELLASDVAQRRLFDTVQEAKAEAGPKIDEIVAKYEGAEGGAQVKRKTVDSLVAAVKEKCERKGYARVGDMGDMVRGRINLADGADTTKVLADIQSRFPKAEFDIKEDSPYPRIHVDIELDNGVLFELQVGTHATTTFLEKSMVPLPDALHGKVGLQEADFHVAKYDIVDKVKDPELRAKYGLDEFDARYNAALKNTGTGEFDAKTTQDLTSGLGDIMLRMEADDPDYLRSLYTKDKHVPPASASPQRTEVDVDTEFDRMPMPTHVDEDGPNQKPNVETSDDPEANTTHDGKEHVAEYKRMGDDVYGDQGPRMEDVNQGYLADCYLMAGMASIAKQRPDLIQKMIVDHGDGTVTVKIHTVPPGFFVPPGTTGANMTEIRITKDLPSANKTRPTYGRGAEGQLWPALIEKAFAVHEGRGKYQGLNTGGSTAKAMSAITGGKSQSFNTKSKNSAMLMVDLDAALNQKRPVCAGSMDKNDLKTNAALKKLADEKQVFPWHAYVVDKVDIETGMIHMYNPWGSRHPKPLTPDEFQQLYRTVYVNEAPESAMPEMAAPTRRRLDEPLTADSDAPVHGEDAGHQRRWGVEQYIEMWEAEHGTKMTDAQKRTLDRGCIGITALELDVANPPLDKAYASFDGAEAEVARVNAFIAENKDKIDPVTGKKFGDHKAVLFAKLFWSNQDASPDARKQPAPDAYLPDPKTGRVDMSDYQYRSQPGYINFDYGFWDPSTQSFWHANHSQPGMKVYQSTKDKFGAGYIDFDRVIYCVGVAKEYDASNAARSTTVPEMPSPFMPSPTRVDGNRSSTPDLDSSTSSASTPLWPLRRNRNEADGPEFEHRSEVTNERETTHPIHENDSEAAAATIPSVTTPYGPAHQSDSPAALIARKKVEQGAALYRIGTMDRSQAAEAQFWSMEHPLTPGFAERHGIPAGNIERADFIEVATLKPGTDFVTRPAPGVGDNAGGGIEVVVPESGVIMESFNAGSVE